MKDKLAGGLVALVLGAAGLAIVWSAPWWVTGAALAGWIAVNEYKLHRAANPAPPPPPEGADGENTQFRYIEDRSGHWSVERVEDN